MSGRSNQWLRRNLHETGLPLPGFEGVYLRPGRLAVLSAGDAGRRTDFLLEMALSALVGSRAVLLLSRSPVSELRERLTDLRFHDVDEVSESMQRGFRRLRAEYFVAYNRHALEPGDLEKEIADFTSYENGPPALVLLDAGVMRSRSRGMGALARMALDSRAAWIVAGGRGGGNTAPIRLRFEAAAANLHGDEPGPFIHIA